MAKFYLGAYCHAIQDLAELQLKVMEFYSSNTPGEYYPDKVGITSMRTYFTSKECNSSFERISKIIFKIQRIRERTHFLGNSKHKVATIVATFDRYGYITLSI